MRFVSVNCLLSSVGQQVKVLGEAYTAEDDEDMAIVEVTGISVSIGRFFIDVNSAVAGNWYGLLSSGGIHGKLLYLFPAGYSNRIVSYQGVIGWRGWSHQEDSHYHRRQQRRCIHLFSIEVLHFCCHEARCRTIQPRRAAEDGIIHSMCSIFNYTSDFKNA